MKYYNIPVFVPHKGCPYDCIFCNQKRITGNIAPVDENTIDNTIKEYLKTLPKNSDETNIEVAFFGGSFTGIDLDTQVRFLSTAYKYVLNNDISGIRISTRPDYISDEILKTLKRYGVTVIELGVQSLDEEVLKISNRGHTEIQVYEACELIRKYDFKLGLQMMTELPGDTDEKALNTADKIISLKPDFVRIYPTLVISDTRLEQMYIEGTYSPRTVDEAVELCTKLLDKFTRANIKVIRISLQTTDEISKDGCVVAGPFDEQFRERVESRLYYYKFLKKLKELKINKPIIYVNNKELSKAIGKKRENIIKLSKILSYDVKIKASKNVSKGDFIISNGMESEGLYCISND